MGMNILLVLNQVFINYQITIESLGYNILQCVFNVSFWHDIKLLKSENILIINVYVLIRTL